MRSRQLNFFILPDEWGKINQFLLDSEIAVISQPIYDIGKMYTDDITQKKPGDFDKVYLTSGRFRESIKTEYIETQEYYLVDDYQSCAIAFSRGGFYQGSPYQLHRARLYLVSSYYDKSGTIVKKDEEFLKWSAKIIKGFKDKFLLKDSLGNTLSEGVVKWMKENDRKVSPSGLYIE